VFLLHLYHQAYPWLELEARMSIRISSALVLKDGFLAAMAVAICLQVSSIQAQPVFENGFEALPACEPSIEICNGIDDDCDGLTDGDDGDLVLMMCENQLGVCAGAIKGVSECQGVSGWAACGAVNYSNWSPHYQTDETMCDGVDNDCDGEADGADVATNAPLNDNQNGLCAGSVKTCTGPGGWINNYSSIPSYEMFESGCNGIDENCDGIDGQASDNCPYP
jgi:hypothetical protein